MLTVLRLSCMESNLSLRLDCLCLVLYSSKDVHIIVFIYITRDNTTSYIYAHVWIFYILPSSIFSYCNVQCYDDKNYWYNPRLKQPSKFILLLYRNENELNKNNFSLTFYPPKSPFSENLQEVHPEVPKTVIGRSKGTRRLLVFW